MRPSAITLPTFDADDGRRGPSSSPDEEVEAKDESTWAGSGNPFGGREHTAEVSYFEETETNIEWNGPSSPMGASEDTLNFEARGGESHGDYPTEPGFGTDAGSLSALRDAMRTPAPPRGRASPGPLSLPPPRARTNPGIRVPAPPRRGAVHPGPPAPPPRGRPAPNGATPMRRRRNGLAATLGPIVAGAIVVLFLGLLALRMVLGGPAPEVATPMLPVVGGPTPKEEPAAPFDIPAPQPFHPDLLGAAPFDPDLAPIRIVELQAAGDYVQAAAWADRLARVSNRPELFFHVGELMAAAGDVDSAMYWIARSAHEHGFAPEWLVPQDHRELAALWADARWNAFAQWAVRQHRFYAAGSAGPATIVLPASLADAAAKDAARPGAPRSAPGESPTLPVVIWLDQAGGNGSSVLAWGQKVADELGVIVVGVAGPERLGPSGSWWTKDARRDREHVESALAAVMTAHPDPKRRYLVGLGQGAQYAVELVLRDPDFAAGALAISPTNDLAVERDRPGEGRQDRTQKVLLTTGALVPEIHTLLRMDLGRLQRSKVDAAIAIDEVPWPWPDHEPPDLGDRVLAWVTGMVGPAPAATPEATTPPATPVPGAAPATPAAPAPGTAPAAPAQVAP